MVPTLINKDVSESSYNDLKFMVQTRDYICTNLVFKSEKAMAPHSSTLAWKIPWTEEPGRLQSMESQKVRHDSATSLSLFTFMQWRRKWQLTPVPLPGKCHGRRSVVDCSPWGRKESDTTERFHFSMEIEPHAAIP